MKYFHILYFFWPLRLPTHLVNASCPSRKRAGTIWNKEGIDQFRAVKPTFKKIPARELSLLESEKSFLKCQKRKTVRESKENERKKKKQKEKEIPSVTISEAKTGSFVYKPRVEKTTRRKSGKASWSERQMPPRETKAGKKGSLA